MTRLVLYKHEVVKESKPRGLREGNGSPFENSATMANAASDFMAKMSEKLQLCRQLGKGCLHCSFSLGPKVGCFFSMWKPVLASSIQLLRLL